MSGTKLVIPDKVYNKIMHWVNKADFEVSGFGTVVFDKASKTFRIEDAFLIKQEGSAAATEICAKDLGKAMGRAHRLQLKGSINFWWHSHVNMDVFWSGTDRSTIEDLGKNGYILATVFNKKWEMRSAFCTNVEVPYLGPRVEMFDNFATEIEYDQDLEQIKQWDKDFEENVKRHEYKPMGQQWGNWHEYESAYQPTALTSASRRAMAYEWEPETPEQKKAIRAEAQALGMTYHKYLNTLNYGSYEDLDMIEKQLEEKGLVPCT